MNIMRIILAVLFEAAYIFACIRICKPLRGLKNAALFGGIAAANLASGILYMTVWRYLFAAVLIFGLLKLAYKKEAYFYDLFVIFLFLSTKFTIEFFIFIKFGIDGFDFLYAMFIGLVIALLPLILCKQIKFLYNSLCRAWNNGEAFYLRYLLSLAVVATIMVYLGFIVNYMNEVI